MARPAADTEAHPAPLKLGGSYSTLAFLAMVLVPLPIQVPLFVPLLIGAAGCLALCVVAAFDLALGLCLQRLQPRVPALALAAEAVFGEQSTDELSGAI